MSDIIKCAHHARKLDAHDVYPNLVNQCLSWITWLDCTLALSETYRIDDNHLVFLLNAMLTSCSRIYIFLSLITCYLIISYYWLQTNSIQHVDRFLCFCHPRGHPWWAFRYVSWGDGFLLNHHSDFPSLVVTTICFPFTVYDFRTKSVGFFPSNSKKWRMHDFCFCVFKSSVLSRCTKMHKMRLCFVQITLTPRQGRRHHSICQSHQCGREEMVLLLSFKQSLLYSKCYTWFWCVVADTLRSQRSPKRQFCKLLLLVPHRKLGPTAHLAGRAKMACVSSHIEQDLGHRAKRKTIAENKK